MRQKTRTRRLEAARSSFRVRAAAPEQLAVWLTYDGRQSIMRRVNLIFFAMGVTIFGGCTTPNVASRAEEPQIPTTLAIGSKGDSEILPAELLDRRPQALKRVPPQYPREARSAGIQGVVVVQFTVDSSGFVRDVAAIKSPDAALSKAAEDAISQWEFTPGEKGGRAVNCRMTVPIAFAVNAW
jgi:TonB family protein